MPTCAECGVDVAPAARFCRACGAAQAIPGTDLPGTEVEDSAVGVSAVGGSAVGGDDPTDLAMPVAGAPARESDPGAPFDPTTVVPIDLVTCPSCGASNAASRPRCGRCDTPLREAEPVVEVEERPVPPALPLPADPHVPAPRARRRRGPVLVMVGGVAAGTLVGLLLALGVIPTGSSAPAILFDPLAYPNEPATVQPATAGATSTGVPAGDRTFGPEHTADGDTTTAWMATVVDEVPRLQHRFLEPVWIERIEFAAGDQVDGDTWSASGRPIRVDIDVSPDVRIQATLLDQPGFQELLLPVPVLTDEVNLRFLQVAGGDAPAVSEIRYVGHLADDEDRAAHRAR